MALQVLIFLFYSHKTSTFLPSPVNCLVTVTLTERENPCEADFASLDPTECLGSGFLKCRQGHRGENGFALWVSRRVRQGVGKSIDQAACVFPFHTLFSHLDERILELKGTLEIIYSTHSFLQMKKQNGGAICLQPQLVVGEDGVVFNPLSRALLCVCSLDTLLQASGLG